MIEVVHGTRRRADDDARLHISVHEFAERVRVLEVLVVDEPHGPAHQMGRADRLAPRVVVRVARGDLKVVVRGIIFCCSDPFLREKVMRARKVTN